MTTNSNLIKVWRTRMNTGLVRNLFEENDVLKLSSASKKACMPEIAGVEIQIDREREAVSQARSIAIQIALQAIHTVLSDWQIWILGCHGAWQPDSRVVSYNKLWKSLESRGLKLPKGGRIEELAQKTEEGQRWFGGVKVDIDEISFLGPIINNEPYSFITVFPKSIVPDLVSIMNAGWLSLRDSELIGWSGIACEICRIDGILLRPFGGFDDIEIGTTILSSLPLATEIQNVLEP